MFKIVSGVAWDTPFTTKLFIINIHIMANKVILIGRVGQDPTIRDVQNTKVASFTLATTERGYTKKDGTQVSEKTDWHNIVAWGAKADFVGKYVSKGDKIYVAGKITYRTSEYNGTKRTYTDIIIEDVEFLSRATNKSADGASSDRIPQSAPMPNVDRQPQPTFFDQNGDDEMPF